MRDYGQGVPEEKIAQLLQPFFRVDDARQTRSGGYGLGLAIANRVISLYRGDIEITNAVPTGLQVVFKLPENLLAK